MKKISDYITEVIEIALFIIVFDALFGLFLRTLSNDIKEILSDLIIIIIKSNFKEDRSILEIIDVPIKIAIARIIIKLVIYFYL